MPPQQPTTSGSRIRVERERRGLTQIQLADEAGVSQATLSRIEVAGGGRASTLARISDALQIPVDELVGAQDRAPLGV